jgi:hypothetical protein
LKLELSLRIPIATGYMGVVTWLGKIRPKISHAACAARLPSPSRHIYKSLTIAVAFRRLGAFDRVWQHPIKVDGTFV